MNGKKTWNWKIGNFEDESFRGRPSQKRVNNFLDEMSEDFSDFDVYLWGSWPERKETWDVDFLLNNPDFTPNTEQMEGMFVNSLRSSLVNNSFLADVGIGGQYGDLNITPFSDIMERYNETGETTSNAGYIYADKWYADDTVIRDRTKLTEGSISDIGNNVIKKVSTLPYGKMRQRMDHFDEYYKNKPLLLKQRRKIYG